MVSSCRFNVNISSSSSSSLSANVVIVLVFLTGTFSFTSIDTLSRTSSSSSTFLLLFQKSNSWWNSQTKTFSKLVGLKFCDIKDRFVPHQINGFYVRLKSSLGRFLQILVTRQVRGHLLLNRKQFDRIDFYFGDWYFMSCELLQHGAFFRLQQHQQTLACRRISCCAASSVDVCHGIFGTIQLKDPIHCGEVQTPGSDICGEHHGGRFTTKLLVNCHSTQLME